STVCKIDKAVLDGVRKSYSAKIGDNFNVFIAKIDKKDLLVVPEETLSDATLEDVIDSLPEDSPRYLTLSFKWVNHEGRTTYPLAFIYYCPPTSPPTDMMLYASTQPALQTSLNTDKAYHLQDSEDLTQEWLNQHLKKFAS
ncbi:hypothetical protein BB560_002205, partial [Smittium megazygosporum]